MQTQQSKEKPFLNNIVKNEDCSSMCAVKQDTNDDTRQLASPTFHSPVKLPLIDSPHEIVTPTSKRIKQERDDPSFWENKERLLLSNKTSLQNIVSGVVHSFESNNCAKIASFQEFESTNGVLSAEVGTTNLESSPGILESSNEVKAACEKVEIFYPTVDCRKEKISPPSIAAQAQSKTSQPVEVLAPMPVVRPLKSKDSGISEGLAYDHNLFPKLVDVHSVLSPTSSPQEVEIYHDVQQTKDAPWLKKLDQNQETDYSSLLQIADSSIITPSNGSVIRHGATEKCRTMTYVPSLLSRAQTSTTCDGNVYKTDVLESSKVHAQNTPRTLPMIPFGLANDNLPDLSTDAPSTRADVSDPWEWANLTSQRKHEAEPQATYHLFGRSDINTSLHKNQAAASTAHAHAQAQHRHRENRQSMDSTSQLSPVPSEVSPRVHDQSYLSKQSLHSFSQRSAIDICDTSLPDELNPQSAPHAQAQDCGRRQSLDSRSQLSPVLSEVSPRVNHQSYSSKQSLHSFAKGSTGNICDTSLPEEPVVKSAPHVQAQECGRPSSVDSTSQPAPVPPQVSSSGQDQNCSSKQSSSSSSKKFKSVNMKEVVNIYRMAAGPSSHKNQSKDTSDTKSQEPCDLLFSFTKPEGKCDLFLVVKDEVYAVKRFDYKGVTYLIHTDNKGKTSILAKLPEDEKWKLENKDGSASSGQQFTAESASASDIASNGAKQSKHTSSQDFTSQSSTEASLNVTALQNSFKQVFTRDSTHAAYGDTLTHSDNDRPMSFSRSGSLNSERRRLLKQILSGIREEASCLSQRSQVTKRPQSLADGQQSCPSLACADSQDRHHRTLQNPYNAGFSPKSPHASSDSWGNQRFKTKQFLATRNEGTNEGNLYRQEQMADTISESTYNGKQAFSTQHRNHFSKETMDEDRCGTFSCCGPSLINQKRTMQKLKLMDYLARRMALRQQLTPPTVNVLECDNPGSRRCDVTRQAYDVTMTNGLSTKTTDVLTSRCTCHEELPPQQHFQRIKELLAGTTANATRTTGGAHSSSRKRTFEGSQVPQSVSSTSPTLPFPNEPQTVIQRLVNFEDESPRKRTASSLQQRAEFVDTTSDWLMHEDCTPGFTSQRLLNNQSFSGLHSNQSRTRSPLPPNNDVSDFIQEPKRRAKDTASRYFPNSVLENPAKPSNCHSFISRSSDNDMCMSVCTGQQHFNGKRHPGHSIRVSECDDFSAFNKAVPRTGPFLKSVSVIISGQQSCIDDISLDTVEVTKPGQMAKPFASDQTATDDEDVEIISPPPKDDFWPFRTTLDVENKANDEMLMADAYNSPNSSLRAAILRKIHATHERIAHDKNELTRRHCYPEKTELEKRSGAVDFIVIDDD